MADPVGYLCGPGLFYGILPALFFGHCELDITGNQEFWDDNEALSAASTAAYWDIREERSEEATKFAPKRTVSGGVHS